MARIRSIKPQFWTSEQIADCSPNARLLFIGLWNFCDDYGVHPASPARLKMEAFPNDAFSKPDIRAMVDELLDAQLLTEYEVSGKLYPIGYFHVDIAEVQTNEGRLYLFVAIDRTSKFAYAELHPKATRMVARDFLSDPINAVPYTIHTLLTDNGIQFAKRKGTEGYREIPFDRVCRAQGIEHRLTKVCHPWTNGQVERMNRTIKEATVKRYHYQSHDQLKSHCRPS